MSTATPRPAPPSEIPREFLREELGQAIEMFRTLWSLVVQVGVGLVAANVALLGWAVSKRLITPVMFGSLFPTAIVVLVERIRKAMAPVVFTAVSLEDRFGGQTEDWLMATFVSTNSDEFVDRLRSIAAQPTKPERMRAISSLRIPVRFDRPLRVSMLSVAAAQLVSPAFLVFVPGWQWF